MQQLLCSLVRSASYQEQKMVELRGFFPLIIACIQVDLEFYKPSSPIVLGAVCLKNKFLFAHFGQHCNQGSHICWILFNLIDRNLAVKCSPYGDFSCRKASAFAIKWTGDCSLPEEAASSSRWLRRTGFKSELALHLELSTSLKKKNQKHPTCWLSKGVPLKFWRVITHFFLAVFLV